MPGSLSPHVQKVAACFALGPQTLLRAAEKGHFARFHRSAVSILVHETKHQHIFGVGILYDCRDKPVHFIEIQCHSTFIFMILQSYIFPPKWQAT